MRRRPAPGNGGSQVVVGGGGGQSRNNYPGAQVPPPGAPHYVHPSAYGGPRGLPQNAAVGGMFPYVDGSRPPELRGANLYPWRPMPRQVRPAGVCAGEVALTCPPFPPTGQQQPPQMAKTYTIKNDVNLKKASLKLVPSADEEDKFHLGFNFDASTGCRIEVYIMATEVEGGQATYLPRESDAPPTPVTFNKGLGQYYQTAEPVLDMKRESEEDLKYTIEKPRNYPIIIKMEAVVDGACGLRSASGLATRRTHRTTGAQGPKPPPPMRLGRRCNRSPRSPRSPSGRASGPRVCSSRPSRWATSHSSCRRSTASTRPPGAPPTRQRRMT